MGFQSKCDKIKGKCDALQSKLQCSISLEGAEDHKMFLRIILERSLGEEKQTRKEMEEIRRNVKEQRNEMSAEEPIKGNKNPFIRLPDEMVEAILKKLSDPEDLIRSSNACKLFERILEPTKPIWLFQRILPYVANEAYVTTTDILNFRLVCVEWRRVVDELVQNVGLTLADLRRSYKSVIKQVQTINLFGEGFRLAPSLETLQLDRLSMQNHIGNPFVARKLFMQVSSEADAQFLWQMENNVRPDAIVRYWQEAVKFLKVFGYHLWEFKLALRHLHVARYFQITRRCLRNLQNVKKVSLHGAYRQLTCTPDDEGDVEQNLVENPFPELKHLDCLELDAMHDLFYKHVFPVYAPQLRRLSIYVRAGCLLPVLVSSSDGGGNLLLENLMELSVRQENGDESMLLSLECPRLIDLHLAIMPSQVKPATLLKVLQQFGERLKRVRVDYFMDHEFTLADFSTLEYKRALPKLHLPHVQILTLVGWPESLDILLCMPSLNYVEVMQMKGSKLDELSSVRSENDGGDILGIQGYENRLYESDIWIFMPNLMEIDLSSISCTFETNGSLSLCEGPECNYSYTREGYEYFQRKNNR